MEYTINKLWYSARTVEIRCNGVWVAEVDIKCADQLLSILSGKFTPTIK